MINIFNKNKINLSVKNDNKNCHAENNSPKFRMASKILCHPELNSESINADFKASSPRCGEGKINGCMNQNNFSDKVFSCFIFHFLLKKLAFTLVEILITLGIIGVVAALTMPTLIANYRQQVAVAKLKKMYSTLSQAMLFTIQEEGDYSSLDVKDHDSESVKNWYKSALKPHLKITKECFDEVGCWTSDKVKYLDGYVSAYGAKGFGTNVVVFNTIDGYSVTLDGISGTDILGVHRTSGQDGLAVYVDINGQKLPNVVGKDIFAFVFIPERGLVPAGKDKTNNEVKQECSKNDKGLYCFEKIMRNGWNIDKENLW